MCSVMDTRMLIPQLSLAATHVQWHGYPQADSTVVSDRHTCTVTWKPAHWFHNCLWLSHMYSSMDNHTCVFSPEISYVEIIWNLSSGLLWTFICVRWFGILYVTSFMKCQKQSWAKGRMLERLLFQTWKHRAVVIKTIWFWHNSRP